MVYEVYCWTRGEGWQLVKTYATEREAFDRVHQLGREGLAATYEQRVVDKPGRTAP